MSSTRIMGVIVAANPKLQQEIEAQYHAPYAELSISEKRDITRFYNDVTHAYQIADDINFGRILPTELAFSAFGEQSGVVRRSDIPDMHSPSEDAEAMRWSGHQASKSTTEQAVSFASRLELEDKNMPIMPILH